MKINVKKITKEDNIITIYAKIPIFSSFSKYYDDLRDYFYDEDAFLGIGIDVTGKYAILRFVLRNKKDILPYIKYNENK